jgi:hypothetical protein
MPYTTAFGDEPIWNESTLHDMARDPQRSAQTRNWALETLSSIQRPRATRSKQDELAAVPLAVDMLDDPEPYVAAHALTLLEQADGAECSRAVALFAKRRDTPLWSRLLATVFLASCGNNDAIEVALESSKARAYFGLWAQRDPQGFADAVCDAWLDDGFARDLAQDVDFLHACSIAARPELAGPLLDAVTDFLPQQTAREELTLSIMSHAGFGVPPLNKIALGEDMTVQWHPRDDQTFDSRVDRDRLDHRHHEFAELVTASAWAEVVEHCLETIELLSEMGASQLNVPTLRWALALRDGLVSLGTRSADAPGAAGENYQRAQLAFALQEAVMLVFDIEDTLERRDGLDDALDLYGWSIGAQRDRLEDIIGQRWQPNADNRQVITSWLDDLDDEFEWFDALGVASRLPGYNISPCLLQLIDEVESDAAGFDTDWAADTVLEVLASKPRAIAANPDRLLLGDTLVSECTLKALGAQPWRWASNLILERLDRLAGTHENEILWETLAQLGDPRSLDRLIDYWQSNKPQPDAHRLAHAIGFVADLSGRLDELPDAIRQELNELSRREGRYQDRLEAMIDGDLADGHLIHGRWSDDERLALELKCTACETTDTYQFDELYLDHERGVDLDSPFEAILCDRVVECHQCHARDQIEATERSSRDLTVMLAALIKAEHWPQNAPIQVWHPELWDGTSFDSAIEGIERLKAQAQAQPNRAEPWRRLGHFCTRFHADSDALNAYEHAHSLDNRGVPDPKELREFGIPTAPVGPEEASALLGRDISPGGKARHQIHECLVSTGWREVEGLCSVFVSRKVSEERTLAAAFLVDLGCQGVKEVIFATALDSESYGDLRDRIERLHGQLESCTPELAARILDTAVRFSLALGFFPPDDYFAARRMFEGIDPEATTEDVPTGESGLPVYVGDPDANEPVIERLYRRTGPDGFASL